MPAFMKAFWLFILFILLLYHTFYKIVLFPLGYSHAIGLSMHHLFLRRQIEDLKEIIYVEMVKVDGFQYDLAYHEMNIVFLQFYFFEKFIKIYLIDRILAISFLAESLEDMLLVLSNELSNLDKHLFFFVLIY